MKLIQRFYLVFALLASGFVSHAQIKVGDNPTTLNAAAVLEIESITKGFLLPRMTDTQMNAIVSPPAGLMVYNTTNNCTYIYKGGAWASLCASTPSLSISNDSLTISGGNTVVLPSAPIQTASNGLGLVGSDVQLGGTLSSATSIVTSSSNTLSIKNLQTGASSDSLVTVASGGVLKKIAASTFTDSQTLTYSNDTLTISSGNNVVLPSGWKLDGNAVTATKKLGTTSAYPLPIITNNVERVRIDTAGRVGVGTSSPTSTFQVNGSVAMNIVSKSANYTLTATDYTVLCDASTAGFTVTLPAASTCTGRIYRIVKIDETSNILTFSTSLRYSKNTSITTLNYNKTLTVQSDGTDWWIIAQY